MTFSSFLLLFFPFFTLSSLSSLFIVYSRVGAIYGKLQFVFSFVKPLRLIKFAYKKKKKKEKKQFRVTVLPPDKKKNDLLPSFDIPFINTSTSPLLLPYYLLHSLYRPSFSTSLIPSIVSCVFSAKEGEVGRGITILVVCFVTRLLHIITQK